MALPLLPIEWKFEVDFAQFIPQWPIRLLNSQFYTLSISLQLRES